MAERPILFSGPLVRAILAGRKTETRRLVNRRESHASPLAWETRWLDGRAVTSRDRWGDSIENRRHLVVACENGTSIIHPRVEPNDILWVRETFAVHDLDFQEVTGKLDEKWPRRCVIYRADQGLDPSRWRPSIHMPRWAARIFLRVTDVRAERLQAIDDAGAIAEGIDGHPCGETCPCCEGSGDFANDPRPGCKNCSSTGRVLVPRREFSRIWDAIYGNKPGASWDAGPWVWVIKFEREEPTP